MACQNERQLWLEADQQLSEAVAARTVADQELIDAEAALVNAQANAKAAGELVDSTADKADLAYGRYIRCLTGETAPVR